jgi:hypothetical protein
LEGVEDVEAPALATALRRAVDAANGSCGEQPSSSANMPQAEADAVAREIARRT